MSHRVTMQLVREVSYTETRDIEVTITADDIAAWAQRDAIYFRRQSPPDISQLEAEMVDIALFIADRDSVGAWATDPLTYDVGDARLADEDGPIDIDPPVEWV